MFLKKNLTLSNLQHYETSLDWVQIEERCENLAE